MAVNIIRRRMMSLIPCFTSLCTFSSNTSSNFKVKIFDRHLKRMQRDRAAWLMHPNDVFVDTVAENLLDRLEDCRRTFPDALCLGGSLEAIQRLLRGRGGIKRLIMMDTSQDMLKLCRNANKNVCDDIETFYVVGDEEFLPIKECSLDLVISCLGLHWTNDFPGAMIQCQMALKPDGLFLAAFLGGETLKFVQILYLFIFGTSCIPFVTMLVLFHCEILTRELRIACTMAQMEREGGVSPRISPMAQVRDAGNLLTMAGFTLPGVDVDEYKVKYKSALELIQHLRSMGETNALLERNHLLKRETALATAAIYESMFADEHGLITATFQVIYMTGWKEHPSQQRSKSRGSATVSFDDIHKHFGSHLDSTTPDPPTTTPPDHR